MADSPAFDAACERLAAETALSALEARGTVRFALRDAGLEARSVSSKELAVVVTKLLPKELTARGVKEADAVCRRIADALSALKTAAAADTPEAVFGRLGGR